MTDQEVQEHVAAGLAAVLDAGPIALDYFRKMMDVEEKMPGVVYDPVTEADKRIEAAIRESIGAKFPDHRIIGEEHGDTGRGDTYWIIDPIDGTRAFISGMPTWGVLLGFVHDGNPVGGIMHQPFTGETWVADPVGGARFLHHGQETPLKTRADATLPDAILYSTYPLFDSETLERYHRIMERCRMHRWGGDCYAFALLAQGAIDLMIEGMLQPYDIVPLIPIIEGAGGVVTNLKGETPMQGGTVIAAANKELHEVAMEMMHPSA